MKQRGGSRGGDGRAPQSGRKKGSRKNTELQVVFLLAAIGILLIALLFMLPASTEPGKAGAANGSVGRTPAVQPDESGKTDPSATPGATVTALPESQPAVSGTAGGTAPTGDPVGISAPHGASPAPEPAPHATATTNASEPPIPPPDLTSDELSPAGNGSPAASVSKSSGTVTVNKPASSSTAPEKQKPAVKKTVSTTGPKTVAPKPVRIALVIDDVGNNMSRLTPFLRFPGPVTFAVLPDLSHTKDALQAILKAGKQAILHLPMEAVGGVNPGPGALYLSMSDEEILRTVRHDLDQLPGILGVNNHQGSAVTRDERIMRLLLRELSARGLFFLDSMTTPDSTGRRLSSEFGLAVFERDVFLDNDKSEAAIRAALEGGLEEAKKKAGAVMIGHVDSARLASVLREQYSALLAEGFEFSYLEDLLRSSGSGKSLN